MGVGMLIDVGRSECKGFPLPRRKLLVDTSAKCNVVMRTGSERLCKFFEESLERRFKAETFSWRGVQGDDGLLEIGFTDSVDVEPAGQPAPQPAIGIFL